MANPNWITSENIKFNGTLDNAAILATVDNVRSAILWDPLSPDDQTILTNFVDNHGGALPLAGPTSGSQTIDFSGTVVGANATGLNNVATATAAKATIDVGGDKTGSTASGLSSSAGTQGYQFVNYTANLTTGTVTNLVPTAGYQYINFSALAAGTATNLVELTTYTSTITVDGVAKSVSILGSNAQTFTELVAQLNTAVGASATVTLDASGKRIKITSATLGTSSTILTVQGTLFAAPLTNFTNISAAVAGTKSTAALTATIIVDGVSKAINVLPATITTFGNVITAINTDLGGDAIASITSGNIKITSATYGVHSTVVITPGTLFAALPGYLEVFPSQPGGGLSRSYSATVIVDDVIKTVNFTGALGDTFQNVITEINTDLGASATAAITGGNIVITSATTGTSSTVSILDNTLFKAVNAKRFKSPINGITSLLDAFGEKTYNGNTLAHRFNVLHVGLKPHVPTTPAMLPKIPQFTYYATTGGWKYLADDSVVNP